MPTGKRLHSLEVYEAGEKPRPVMDGGPAGRGLDGRGLESPVRRGLKKKKQERKAATIVYSPGSAALNSNKDRHRTMSLFRVQRHV
jgi:hypothetical protein